MKKILKRLLVILLIFLTINASILSNVAHAGVVDDFIEGVAAGIIGIFAYPIQLFLSLSGKAINLVTGGVAGVDDEDGKVLETITPFDILFSQETGKINIVNVNFFDSKIESDSIVGTIQSSVAAWYYILRMIACAILLVILIYVGIRMALTTIASDKAMFNKMLTDWACSVALIFLLQYIMIFTFNVNDALVKAMYTIAQSSVDESEMTIADAFGEIFLRGFHFGVDGIGASVVYFILVIQTIGLLISYINRMLKVAFLMIISPLITLTYSIDKMGDGKAQALSTWLKEFVYTVLIQPFHCIIYIVMVGTALNLLVTAHHSTNLGFAVLAIMCVKFVQDGEKIVRKIFHFEDDNSGTSIAAGMAMSAMALSKSKSIGKSLKSGVTSAKNLGRNAKNMIGHIGTDALVLGSMISGKNKVTDSEGNTHRMSYAETKEQIKENKEKKFTASLDKEQEAQAQKLMKANPGMTKQEALEKAKEPLNKRAEEIQKANPGMSKSAAMARARAEKGREAFYNEHKIRGAAHKANRKINGFTSKVSSKVNAIKQLDTFKDLQGIASAYMAMGTGVAVGVGMYGSGQNLMQASMAGAAAYGSMREFSKDTTSTLVNDAVQSVAALSGETSEEKEAELREISQKDGSEYEDGSDRIKDILNNLERQLQALGMDKKSSNKFKNRIHNEVRANALKGNPTKISDIVKNNIETYNNSAEGSSNPINMAKDFSALNNAAFMTSDFENEKITYNNIQKLVSGGASIDTAIDDILKQYNAYNSSDLPPVDREFSSERYESNDVEFENPIHEYNDNVSELDKEVESATQKEVDRVIEEFKNSGQQDLDENFARDIMDDAKAEITTELQDKIREVLRTVEKEGASKTSEIQSLTTELQNQIKTLESEKTTLISEKDKALKSGDVAEIVRKQTSLAENIYKTQYMQSAINYMSNDGKNGGNGGK